MERAALGLVGCSALAFCASWIAEGFPLGRDIEDSTGEYIAVVILGIAFFLILWPEVMRWFVFDKSLRRSFMRNLKKYFRDSGTGDDE